MSITLSLTQEQTFEALRSFLLGVLPAGTEVVQAQDNRVPEPEGSDFVTMNGVLQERLSTNVRGGADALFTGAIAGNTLTISAVQFGAINVGSPVFGVGIPLGTSVTALGTGSGGVGTYTLSGSPLTIASEPIAAGIVTLLYPQKVTIQLDVHGPASADNAVIIAGAFRDGYAFEQFQSYGYDVAPLYTTDPRQIPFLNAEQQIEQRWVLEAVLQCNPILTIPQQYAGALSAALVEVDASYPPAP
jgi:hypothetical protein